MTTTSGTIQRTARTHCRGTASNPAGDAALRHPWHDRSHPQENWKGPTMRTSTTARTDRPLAATLMTSLLLTLLLLPAVPSLLDGISRRAHRLARGREAGVSVVEWLLLTTIIAAAAITIGAIVIGKFTTKANELDLTTP